MGSTFITYGMWSTWLLVFIIQSVGALDACQKLAVCALDKCLGQPSDFPPTYEVLPSMLSKANFACVLGPTCFEYCTDCETCHYAQEQMKRLILNQTTSGKCPRLEHCAKTCLKDQVKDPFSCVFRQRCAQFCLDNIDCPQCYDIVKRVFTGYCYRAGFIEHYGKKCKPLFDGLAARFVGDLVVQKQT